MTEQPEPPEGSRSTCSAASNRKLFGFPISSRSSAQIVEGLLAEAGVGEGVSLLVTMNVDHVTRLRKSYRFRKAYAGAEEVTIDGAPIYAYAKLAGVPVTERVTGADLLVALIDRWRPQSHRLFFLVNAQETAERLSELLAKRGFTANSVTFVVPDFGFERDEDYSVALATRIQAFRPTHLIMGVGAPKSEIWVHEHRSLLGDVKVLCVGAAIEFAVGLKHRAPRWVQKIGLEWFYRLVAEPRRLFRRYCIDSFGLIPAIFSDWRSAGERVA